MMLLELAVGAKIAQWADVGTKKVPFIGYEKGPSGFDAERP